MTKHIFRHIVLVLLLAASIGAMAWDGMALPRLHVDGRYFKDEQGNIVNLHGFAQTYSPWFNEQGSQWSNYNAKECLAYNQGLIDKMMAAGWKMSFIRLHMDPYWSNTPGVSVSGENDISAFSMSRFKTYFNLVFVPMAKYAVSKGMYVVMRPPGVCPEKIAVGDAYHKYLLKVWGYVAQQSAVRDHPNIMFELANEPVTILDSNGNTGGFKELSEFFQAITDTIRTHCSNIVLVPGLGWQSNYAGFVEHPVKGENVGYAVHCYPGWFNSGAEDTPDVNYADFKAGWDKQIKPVSDFAPVIVTELDWAPAKYNASWGKGVTGTAGGAGFGANFKKIADESGNVSWLIFTGPDLLAKFDANNPATSNNTTFLNDPEACPWPTFQWYEEYSKKDYPRKPFEKAFTADNGNGTFTNPVINADFPDPDVIRVGDTYYMVTTTMHHFPGCTVLKSKDLIHWEYCANPLTRMSANADYNLEDGRNIYSKGDWANTIFYKDGKFHIMFNAFGKADDAGGYLLTATDPEGQWTMKRLPRGYYDPGVLIDDDGTIYVAYGNNDLYVARLDDDFNLVSETKVVTGMSVEGSHFIKKDGYYYIYCTNPAWPATQWCFRSKSVMGGYDEYKELFDQNTIHQGQIIQTQSGEWWTMLMKDNGAIGRTPWLEPITWTDGWPVIGNNGITATTYKKPDVGTAYAPVALPTNDHFRGYQIAKQWQWNHNPDNTKWSLFERPGFLRLYTATLTTDLAQARNTLTQRIVGCRDGSPSMGTVALDVRNMAVGDVAGLTVFQHDYAQMGVQRTATGYRIVHEVVKRNSGSANSNSTKSVDILPGDLVYLRAEADFNTSKVKFYYSLDNITYTQLGAEMTMIYSLDVFVGNRFGIFNYATQETGGYVDIDWFSTEAAFTESDFYDDTFIQYTEESITATGLAADRETYNMLVGSNSTFTITATFRDGHTEDVSTECNFTLSDDRFIKMTNGRISSTGTGTTTVTATYRDKLGNVLTTTFNVVTEMFPLKDGLFNPSIYANGTFVESTGALTTGQYGFGGWQYSGGLDLSPYNYIIVKLKRTQSAGASFRMFDENNYWSDPAMAELSSTTNRINLRTFKKNNSQALLNLSHIYIVGIWTYGGSPVYISDVYVSNDGTTPVDTGVNGVLANMLTVGDVYNLTGQKVLNNATRSEMDEILPKGIYIVNGKKVIVK